MTPLMEQPKQHTEQRRKKCGRCKAWLTVEVSILDEDLNLWRKGWLVGFECGPEICAFGTNIFPYQWRMVMCRACGRRHQLKTFKA